MSKQSIKDQILVLIPDNNVKYVTPQLTRESFGLVIDSMQLEGSGGGALRFSRLFSLSDPLLDGGVIVIPTTLPVGSRFDGVTFIGSGLTDEITLKVYIGSAVDENLYAETDTTSSNSISNIPNNISAPTAVVNSSVFLQAVGGNIISGTLDIRITLF